jgi:hypothetical protein
LRKTATTTEINIMKNVEEHTLIEVGDRFTDPLDGSIRQVSSKGKLMFGKKYDLPHWDDSIFCTDGGCASAKDVWNNIII